MKPIVEHIGINVVDIEKATDFFVKVFDAEFMYDGGPLFGDVAEKLFKLPKGAGWNNRRCISIGDMILELFEYVAEDQREVPRTFDMGITHLGFYVDNFSEVVEKFLANGGVLYPMKNPDTGELEGKIYDRGMVYGETPWGMVVEISTNSSRK